MDDCLRCQLVQKNKRDVVQAFEELAQEDWKCFCVSQTDHPVDRDSCDLRHLLVPLERLPQFYQRV